MHYPIASWNNMARGAIHLHGHVHFEPSMRLQQGKMMDVGVDGNNLYPISINEVLSVMSKQPIKSLFTNDHHEIVENYKKY
jgi:calcineurin-like phosphoesterase family protein